MKKVLLGFAFVSALALSSATAASLWIDGMPVITHNDEGKDKGKKKKEGEKQDHCATTTKDTKKSGCCAAKKTSSCGTDKKTTVQ